MEIYAERYFRPRGAMLAVRAGRFRMPFGIYNRSDHGYSGFLRPPLIRYDGYFGISNNWLEDGAMFTAGAAATVRRSQRQPPARRRIRRSARRARHVDPRARLPRTVRRRRKLRAQQSVSVAAICRRTPGVLGRRCAMGASVRTAGARGIPEGPFVRGRVDNRLVCRRHRAPARNGAVHGGRPRRSRWTTRLPAPRDRRAKRLTLGTRVRLPGPVTLQLNYLRQHGDLPRLKSHSIDFSATYSFRMDR